MKEMSGGGACPLIENLPPATAAVCVTGSTGYIGSWLVLSLLRRGYTVHATARDLQKAAQLQESAWAGSGERLKLFRADMGKEGSYDEALQGCICVFHVAACMDFHVPPEATDIDGYVRREVLQKAVEGAMNLMKSCSRAGSVKRVVFTSSISTVTARDSSGKFKPVVDETSLVAVDSVWQKKPPGWVYILSKVAAEEAAYRFARENSLELVSVVPTIVAGPFLTPQVPASIRVLLSPINKDPTLHPILLAVNARLGSISTVHVDDLVDAHIFLMETTAAEGRYLCTSKSFGLPELACSLSLKSPPFIDGGAATLPPPLISTKKLTGLGFKFKYGAREIVRETIACCIKAKYLKNIDELDFGHSQLPQCDVQYVQGRGTNSPSYG